MCFALSLIREPRTEESSSSQQPHSEEAPKTTDATVGRSAFEDIAHAASEDPFIAAIAASAMRHSSSGPPTRQPRTCAAFKSIWPSPASVSEGIMMA